MLKELDCSEPVDLAGLQYCRQLERLRLGVPLEEDGEDTDRADFLRTWQPYAGPVVSAIDTDLSVIADLPHLIRLSLWGYDLQELSPVCQNPQLTYLSVTSTQLESFSPLTQLPNLQGVYIQSTNVPDVMPLTRIPLLREVGIASVDASADLVLSSEQWLPLMPQLQRLALVGLNLHECRAVAELPQLQEIDLSRNRLNDTTPFAELRQIRNLDLRDNQIVDIMPLAAMVQRNRQRAREITIDLRGNPLTTSSIWHLRNMRTLGATVITGKVEDFHPAGVSQKSPAWIQQYFPEGSRVSNW